MPHPLRELRHQHIGVLQQALAVQKLLLQRRRRILERLHAIHKQSISPQLPALSQIAYCVSTAKEEIPQVQHVLFA